MRRPRLIFAVVAPVVLALAGGLAGPVSANPISPHAWAFGSYYDGSMQQMLIEQWNGTKWAIQAHPTITGAVSETLLGAVATSATNAWTVGWSYDGSAEHSLAVRWNGASWLQQTVPVASTHGDFLAAIAATSASSAWAVGHYEDASQNSHTLIEHWNGSAWSVQTSPDVGLGHQDAAIPEFLRR